MLSRQEEELERRETLRNDASVREQAEHRRVYAPDQSLPKQSSTYHQHAITDADIPRGRFSAIANAQVVGATAVPSYPACSPALAVQLPDEPPLSPDENFAFEPSAVLMTSVEQLHNPASGEATPSLLGADVERRDAGLGLSSDPALVSFPSQPAASSDVKAGSHPFRRRV